MSKLPKRTFVNQICRTCYHTSSNYHALTEVSTQGKTFADMLLEIANINVKSRDTINAPEFMCYSCAQQLKNSHVFVQRAQQVEQELIALSKKSGIEEALIPANREDLECLLETAIEIPQNIELKREMEDGPAGLYDSDDETLLSVKRRRSNKNLEKIGAVENDPINLNSCTEQQPAAERFADGEHSLQTKVKKLELLTESMRKEIERLQTRIEVQNNDLINTIIKQQQQLMKEMPKRMLQLGYNNAQAAAATTTATTSNAIALQLNWPMQTLEDLENLEAKINDENSAAMSSEIALQFGFNVKMSAGLKNIFAIELILALSIDGRHNKKRLLDFAKLVDVLYVGICNDGSTKSMFIEELRKGFRNAKNIYYKTACVNKKKEKKETDIND